MGFCKELLARLGLPPIKRKVPLWAARGVGAAFELLYRTLPLPGEPRLTRFLASELALSHYYNISRAKQDFGYSPRYSMAEAMEITLAWLSEKVV
jgi:nucleoside-diphosphate-sugar epimerase